MAFHGKSSRIAQATGTAPAFGRSRLVAAAVSVAAAGVIALSVMGAGAAAASADSGDLAAKTSPIPTGLKVGIADPGLINESAALQKSQLAAMKAIGITSIRLDANWDRVQYGGPNTFKWTSLDQVVRSVRAAGMSVVLIIDGCPPWAAVAGASGDASPQPASPAQFATWASRVAARYAPSGVSIFEIWNEPNLEKFWQPKPNPVAYTADLVAAYRAIKKVNPAAFVISGGLSPAATDGTNISATDFLSAIYAHGAKGSFDAVGYHPYSYPVLPNSYASWSGWSQMGQTSPSIRSVMARNGDSSRPVWITEVGAPSSGPGGVGQAAQATQFTQVIADAQRTKWIGGLYLYSWQDKGTDQSDKEDWFGLVTAAGSHKPAYAAVKSAINSRG